MTTMIVEYRNLEDRSSIIQANANLYLVEERNTQAGNFLYFEEQPRTILSDQVAEQEQRLADVELALTDLFTGGI